MTETRGPARPSSQGAPQDAGLPHLEETVLATQRYLATVNRLTDDDLRAPSLLPGWSRAHVVTHVARNADAFTRLVHWARTGEPTPMYVSSEQRDADIEEGATRPADVIVHDAGESAARFEAAARGLTPDLLDVPVARTLSSPTFAVGRSGLLRRTEVEVHHADLGLDYGPDDWPGDLVDLLLERRRTELAATPPPGGGCRLLIEGRDEPVDVGITDGTDLPEVSGSAVDVVWWLLGRGTRPGLGCSAGPLPELGRWA